MQAANIGAAFIDGAAAGLCIEIHAIATGAPGHREQALLVIEMIDQAIFEQALGNAASKLMLGFKRIHPTQPHELRQRNFQRHRAAIGVAALTHPRAITRPRLGAVCINGRDRDSSRHADFLAFGA
jgi:hypothetical protein